MQNFNHLQKIKIKISSELEKKKQTRTGQRNLEKKSTPVPFALDWIQLNGAGPDATYLHKTKIIPGARKTVFPHPIRLLVPEGRTNP